MPPITIGLTFLLVLCNVANIASGNQGEISTGDSAVVAAFSDIVISCSYETAENQSYDGQEISWSFNNVEISLVDPRVSVTATNFSSTLLISGATFADSGLYSCKLPGLEENLSTQITVGTSPEVPGNLDCLTRNTFQTYCTWSSVANTNLNVTYIFDYKGIDDGDDEWNLCPDMKENLCKIDLFIFGTPLLTGSSEMRIMATNALGSASDTILFNPETDVQTYPPDNLRAEAISEDELLLKWKKPKETDYLFSFVYRVQYYTEWFPIQTDFPLEIESFNEVEVEYTISGLESYTNHTFQVSCKVDSHGTTVWSEWSEPASEKTLEAMPSGQVEITDTKQVAGSTNILRNITIFWEPLEERDKNGEILYNEVSAIPTNSTVEDNSSIGINPTLTEYTFSDLLKSSSYDIRISACNSVACSTPTFTNILQVNSVETPNTDSLTTSLAVGVTVGVAFIVILVIILAIYHPIILEKIGVGNYFTIAEPQLPSFQVPTDHYHYVNDTWLGDEDVGTRPKYIETFDPLYANKADLKKSDDDVAEDFETCQVQQQTYVNVADDHKKVNSTGSNVVIESQISIPDDVFLENDKVAEEMGDGVEKAAPHDASNQKRIPAESNSSNDSYGIYQRVGENGNLIPFVPGGDKKGEANTEKDVMDSEKQLFPKAQSGVEMSPGIGGPVSVMNLSEEQGNLPSKNGDYVSKDMLPPVVAKELPKDYSMLSHSDPTDCPGFNGYHTQTSEGSHSYCSSDVTGGSGSSGYVTQDSLSPGYGSHGNSGYSCDSDTESSDISSPTKEPYRASPHSLTAFLPPLDSKPDIDSFPRESNPAPKDSRNGEFPFQATVDSRNPSVQKSTADKSVSPYVSIESFNNLDHNSQLNSGDLEISRADSDVPNQPNSIQNSDGYVAQLPQISGVTSDSVDV